MSIPNPVKHAAVVVASVAIIAGGVAVAALSDPVFATPRPGVEARLRGSDEDDCADPASPTWPCDSGSTPAPTLPTPAQTAPVRGVLNLTKQAYINVADKTTVETVEATGTLLPPYQSLPVGTDICFVYTITNNGNNPLHPGIWVDELRDFDTRLGDNGLIAKPGYLTSPQKYHACTTAIYLIAKP